MYRTLEDDAMDLAQELADRTDQYKAHPEAALEIIQDIHSTFHQYLCDQTEEPVCAKPVEVLEVLEHYESASKLRFRAKVRCANEVVGFIDTSETCYPATQEQPADYECTVEFEAEG